MATLEHLRRGIKPFDSKSLQQEREIKEKNADFLAETLWDSGLLTRITRPTVQQLKKNCINFFVTVEVEGEERKIPIVVRTSNMAAQRYRSDNIDIIKRKGIIIIVARDDMEPDVLVDGFKKSLAQHLNIRLPERAGVAELVNAPV